MEHKYNNVENIMWNKNKYLLWKINVYIYLCEKLKYIHLCAITNINLLMLQLWKMFLRN